MTDDPSQVRRLRAPVDRATVAAMASPTASTPRLLLLLPLLLVGVAACAGPPSHLTRLWPYGRTGAPLLGMSTEDGILILSEPHYAVGDVFEMHFPVGNSTVRDWGSIDHLNDDLAVVRPLFSRVARGRLAASLPQRGEVVFLAMRDEDDDPVMEPVRLWRDGGMGNYIESPDDDAELFAREHAGSGLYIHRDGRWQIVGMLAGITARPPGGDLDEVGLGFIGLLEISRIVPDPLDYFEHDIKPLRPDFEFGVPLQSTDLTLPGTEEDPAAPDAP